MVGIMPIVVNMRVTGRDNNRVIFTSERANNRNITARHTEYMTTPYMSVFPPKNSWARISMNSLIDIILLPQCANANINYNAINTTPPIAIHPNIGILWLV